MKVQAFIFLTFLSMSSLVLADGDQVPVPVTQELPHYPDEARSAGIEGRVMLEVMVDAEGRVAEVEVSESSGHDALDEAATEAVEQWTFEPGLKDGEAAQCRVKIPVEFKLADEAELVDFSEIDKGFKVLNQVAPDYPHLTSKQGTAVVSVIIGTDGKVESAEIVESAGSDQLDKTALDAALKWEFTAPVKDSKPVRTKVSIPFKFDVAEGDESCNPHNTY